MDHFGTPCHNHLPVSLLSETKHDFGASDYVRTDENVVLKNFSPPDRLSGRIDESIKETYHRHDQDDVTMLTVPNTSVRQDISNQHGHHAWPGIFDDRLWSTAESCDADPATFTFIQSAWPSSMQDMGGLDASNINQFSSAYLTLGPSQDDTITFKDTPHPIDNTYTPTPQLLEPRLARDDFTRQQGQDRTSSTTGNMMGVDDAGSMIGYVLKNGRFMCSDTRCSKHTFARQCDLRRHYTSLHATDRPAFWCPISDCRRSMSEGGEAFHRKDKLMAHIRKMHPED